MPFPGVLLFGAVVLLASSDAQLHPNPVNSTSLELNGITSAHPNEAQSGQRVKDGDPVDEDDDEEEDERTFGFKGLLGIEKLQQFLQPKVTLGKLGTWISQEKSPDHVFKMYGFHKPGKEPFNNPDFNVWAAYTKHVIQHEPEKAMLTTLRKYYEEDELLRKLLAAKEGDATNTIFSGLYAEWMAAKKSSSDVFRTLGLHEAKTVDAKHAAFARWLSFIDIQSKEQGNSGLIMLSAVTGHLSYPDLIKLLGEGKTEAAQIVRNMLSRFWKKKDLNGAFEVASLKGDGELLASAGFQAWLKFMNSHNKVNPTQKASVFETMERFFGEKQLTTVLVAASKNPKSTELSKELLSKQLARWVKEYKRSGGKDAAYTMEAMFKKLKLSNDENVITNPLFSLWHQYSIDTAHESSLIKVLLQNYEGDALAKMILAAKMTKGSELTAKRVEARLFVHWMDVAKFVGADHDTVARSALKLGRSSDNEKLNPLQGTYDDFIKFSEKSINLKVDAAGTTLDTVQKKLDDSRILNEKIAEEKQRGLKKEQEAVEVEVPTKTKKTLRDFLMEPQ